MWYRSDRLIHVLKVVVATVMGDGIMVPTKKLVIINVNIHPFYPNVESNAEQ